MVFQPFFPPVPENFGLARIEVVGNVEGPSDVVSKLVVVNRRRESRYRVRVARPGIRVQSRVSEVFVGGAMELSRAGLGRDPDLCAGRATVFSSIIRSQNLDLLRGVHVRGAQTGSVRARARGGGSVKGDQVLRVAGPVKIRRALGKAEVKVRQRR